MLYHAYELTHAAMMPWRNAARMSRQALKNPFNLFSETFGARATAAAAEMFINATRRYGKPKFRIEMTRVGDKVAPVVEEVVLSKPFCDLLYFHRASPAAKRRKDPKVLMVAPMSGHYATLLRGTVEAMLPDHEIYITDWIDARDVNVADGGFGLDDYIDYIMEFSRFMAEDDGERVTIMAVCQPGVPVLAATAMMAEDNDPARPSSVILMGSPIDTRRNPTEPNILATSHSLPWFEKNVIVTVPFPSVGFLRRVYPGFLQLSGFMSMNIDRHVDAHMRQFHNLVRGDGDSTASHRAFYDEYRSVMDLSADFYLETIENVFQKHLLPKGEFAYRGDRLIRPEAITDIALMTIEGEKDDITGAGQTSAAQDLCTSLPDEDKLHYTQPEVGHYGVFNGNRFRNEIRPRIRDFIRAKRSPVKG